MRNISTHVKILSLIALLGILYWRDLLSLWQVAFSVRWMGFALTIILLFFVFLYQRRKALKTLMWISQSENVHIAIIFILSIILYVFGSYTPYIVWFHFCSLILFVTAYLTLRFDFRIPRILFMPLTALLFIVPPPIQTQPIETGVFGAWDTPSLIASAMIVIFLAYILKASRSRKLAVESIKPCPLCQSNKIKKGAFCPHCGRLRSLPKPASTTFALTKFFTLVLIVSILAFVSIPIFSFTDKRAAMTFYTPQGKEDQTILQTPRGWVLESSIRQTSYEKEHSEDFVILNTYSSEKYAENKSYILLEIGLQPPHMMDTWQLPGWKRHWENVWLENLVGTRIVLRRQNETTTVLCWTMRLLFNVDSVYQIKQVGISVYMKFTESTDVYPSDVPAEFGSVAVFIIESWKPFSLWTLHALTLSRICNQYKDIFLSAVGVVGIFSFAGWARVKEEEVKNSIENAFLLLEKEAPLLVAISRMRRRKFTGAEVFETYERLAETKEDLNQFYEKMGELSRFDLLKMTYALKDHELLMVWERRIPRI